jgi:hypothetical protein
MRRTNTDFMEIEQTLIIVANADLNAGSNKGFDSTVRLKLPLVLDSASRHGDVWGIGGFIHAFLTSTLYRCVWQDLRPCRFTPEAG